MITLNLNNIKQTDYIYNDIDKFYRQLTQVSKERLQILCGSKQNKFVNDKEQIFAEHEQFSQGHMDKDTDKVVCIFSGNCNWKETRIHFSLFKLLDLIVFVRFFSLLFFSFQKFCIRDFSKTTRLIYVKYLELIDIDLNLIANIM